MAKSVAPPRTDTAAPATRKQIAALHTQRTRLGLDEATYRRALANYRCTLTAPTGPRPVGEDWPALGAPCTSSLHLSRRQARSLITRWTLAGAPVGGPYSGSRVDAQTQAAAGAHPLPTPAQRAFIARLVDEINWRTADGYHGWLQTNLHQDPATAPRSYAAAAAIIEGLKGLQRHGHARPAS
ncbi:MAG: hypothetical protein JZU52_12525 [Lamprocystis purpurea]|jgi:hypothetical protein|uniref:hypothetical protein n=1 Tax=Lamprocystis purpurea TaxID=61598 RepID=UPI00037DEBAD|nr:hypothetical protein [Lamprocystis purpurea]MBV5274420.1 hypothetical protein [Lamprocystis purpurea]